LYLSDEVGFSDVELLPGNPNVVFATAWKTQRKPWTILSGGSAEEGGLYKSVDGGATWEKITEGLPTGLTGKIDLAISPADSSIVYALVEAPDKEGGLFKSVDQGETFKQVSDHKGIRSRPFYYANIDVDPKDPDIVWAMATGYFKSVDGGENWESVTVPHGDNHDMWINPDNPSLFIQGNDGGANVTHNGGQSWSTQFNQPTAELYQVEVDDQYPYWLYAGQQDNYTTIAVPSQAPWRMQHPNGWILSTGGCETGPAVPKPGNHNIVYANCKGRFGVYDKRTGTERGYYVGAANMYGHNPKDLRYRFQRVSPIHVSPHDPGVVYHTSQYVHRTLDEGKTWETISPDLTAFEADKQVISGSPITRDITGEEFYSTIYAIRESSAQAGVIWVGANDGPVHVTRDNGENWENVTPSRLPSGGRVDAVEPSPHDPAKAYVAVLRYQFGDWKPYIYRTNNYGQRWTLLTDGSNGIPGDYPTRVVREDPVREGLLYAGTEYGMFLSFDDGESWQAFQQNLPVTPVTDIRVYRGDLAISTMGRSFWVLDNVSSLRQAAINDLDSGLVVFSPKETVLYRHSYNARKEHPVPDYPKPAVQLDYYLPTGDAGEVTLEILDAGGQVINSYVSRVDSDDDKSQDDDNETLMRSGGPQVIREASLSTDAGLNRFHWDMRHRGAWDKDNKKRFRNGPLAAPGTYTLRLGADNRVAEANVVLVSDPRIIETGTTAADVAGQVDLELKIVALLTEARQLEHELAEKEDEGTIGNQQPQLEKLRMAEGIYMQPMLTNQINYLYNMISKADQAPGQDAHDRYRVLLQEFDEIKSAAGN
jgi:photosystem II stability/assembly factor-like uncharacterized protein